MFTRREEATALVHGTPSAVFGHLDRHERLASHMNRRSWMMAGGRMSVELDEHQGQAVGSVIRLSGRVLGLRLFVEEVVTERVPPARKVWETVGAVRLLVIGAYRMGFEVSPDGPHTKVRVFIEYEQPARGFSRWLAWLLGDWYARWCTTRMARDAVHAFSGTAHR